MGLVVIGVAYIQPPIPIGLATLSAGESMVPLGIAGNVLVAGEDKIIELVIVPARFKADEVEKS